MSLDNGHMQGKTHILPIRVYYEDTDFSGRVYHASYLRFLERGRTEFLRQTGFSHRELAASGRPSGFVVTQIQIKFLSPAGIDDILSVHTSLGQRRGARLCFSQQIEREQQLICQAKIDVASIWMDGQIRRPNSKEQQIWDKLID